MKLLDKTEDDAALQFSVYLQWKRARWSTLLSPGASVGEDGNQLVGQFIVCIDKNNSALQLVNKGSTVVQLDSDLAEDSCNPNVSASFYIKKLPN